MKFRKHLSASIESIFPNWADKFLSYKNLKKQIKKIYPDNEHGNPIKRPRLEDEQVVVVEQEVNYFVELLDQEIDKFNEFFLDKEQDHVIKMKVLQDRVAEMKDTPLIELLEVGRQIVEFHGEMVLLKNYSALNYTAQGTNHLQEKEKNMSIVEECPGFIQVYSDGVVKRFAPKIANASMEPDRGFKSKDIIIDESKRITARVFLPDLPTDSKLMLPVLVYFHGGEFCIGSTTWLGYHVFLGDLAVIAKCIVVSVDYRLAPENKLPVAYEDCYSSLQWLANNVKVEPLLERGDLSRVFLSGDSAGGNIVHQLAVMAIKEKERGVRIKGLLPIHPYFGSEKRTDLEMMEGSGEDVKSNDMFWKLSIPDGFDRDYYGCNVEKPDNLNEDEWGEYPEVVVHVAELDFLKERGVKYAELLKKKGVKKVKLVEAQGETHVYNVFNPESDATRLLQKQMAEFIQSV